VTKPLILFTGQVDRLPDFRYAVYALKPGSDTWEIITESVSPLTMLEAFYATRNDWQIVAVRKARDGSLHVAWSRI
jgi:hypothetical protein